MIIIDESLIPQNMLDWHGDSIDDSTEKVEWDSAEDTTLTLKHKVIRLDYSKGSRIQATFFSRFR